MSLKRGLIFFVCVLLLLPVVSVRAETLEDQQAHLQAQLDQLEAQIAKNKTDLSVTQSQRASFERDVATLTGKIKDAQLAIKARDLNIRLLQGDISQKQLGIETLVQRVNAGKESVAQMMRRAQQVDDTPLIELVLGGGTISDVFQDLDNYAIIQRSLGQAFSQMASEKDDLSARAQALQEQQQEQQDLRKLQVLQQVTLKDTQKEKQTLVAAAKGQEKVYQKVLSDNEKSAAQIRAALFSLRDSTKTVNFGDMFTFAKEAGAATGVRPAIILGILSEESNLGQNVGKGTWSVDMHPTRDVPIFKTICATLGLNPDNVPVSKKQWYGYGGAMGPAQFIPSTWQMYAARIGAASGQNPPNPWDARTAAFATAILMKDNGADAQTPAAERLAAQRYLAGWKNASKPSYSFYGDAVMNLADKYQSQINVIGG